MDIQTAGGNRVSVLADGATSGAGTLRVSERMLSTLVLLLVMGISGWYVGTRLLTGWVPADDGFLAQGALRVMQGQLPQRDFVEIYTGGLNFIHAAAFRLFGVNLVSLRIAVFLFFLAWVPAVYRIAREFVSPIVAGGITLLAVAWSFPNYPAAMPSWYNLFFATFGALALMQYIKKRSVVWLFAAGICGGLSLLVKVIGAYYVAGALLFLAFVEQDQDSGNEPHGSWLYRAFLVISLALYMAVLVGMLRARLGGAELYHFVLPSLAIVIVIVTREAKVRYSSDLQRFARLFRMVGTFAVGIICPILIFLIPYIRSGSVKVFFGGNSASAVGHAVSLAVLHPLEVRNAVYSLLLLICIAAALYVQRTEVRVIGLGFGLALTLLGVISYQYWIIYSRIWFSAATILPFIALFGTTHLLGRERLNDLPKDGLQKLMLLVSLTATCSLVQFPFPVPIYFCYVAPLALLALVAIVKARRDLPGKYILASLMIFYLWYGIFRLVPSHIYELTHTVRDTQLLRMPRGGIRIEAAEGYRQFSEFLQQHSPNGLIYAGINCPHVYFLTGLKNPLRNDGGASPHDILNAIDNGGLKIVVINEAPFFPGDITAPELRNELARRLPNTAEFRGLRVMWKQ